MVFSISSNGQFNEISLEQRIIALIQFSRCHSDNNLQLHYYEAFDNFARTNSTESMTTLIAEYLKERLAEMVHILSNEYNP